MKRVEVATTIIAVAALAVVAVLVTRQEKHMADVKDELVAITNQLRKGTSEVVSKISDLEAKVADGTVTVEDLADLKSAAQALDDVVPDEVPEPTPEPEPETPTDEGTVTPPSDGTV